MTETSCNEQKRPLADILRPRALDEMVGQAHLLSEKGTLRRLIDAGKVGNMIFYGPAGTGKTTAADIIAKGAGMTLFRLNATTAGISDIKDIINQSKSVFACGGILLYLDEIQYFNRKQQQTLLEFIEDGRITLIASTTENPYYYIYNAIISRSSVFEFRPVPAKETAKMLRRAWDYLNRERGCDKKAEDDMLEYLASRAGGDVRRAIGLTENAFYITDTVLTKETADSLSSSFAGTFDREGDVHYDLLSALQKSIRGSDPDATVFYLAKLLAGGDLISPCRRLQVIASEDIGAAYPAAAAIVRACCESALELGLPEAAIPLSNAAVILATAPKSNTAHSAYAAAVSDIALGMGQEIPLHLKSPEFNGYKYPHDYPDSWVAQDYLPHDLKERRYYKYGDNKTEQAAKKYWADIKNKDKNRT